MADNRKTLDYRGYTMVAAFYRGMYQGKAWHKRTDAHLHVVGGSMDDILQKLHSIVDEQFKPDVIAEKHRKFLDSRSKPNKGVKGSGRKHRHSHCYNCTTPVDNAVDLECNACGWIICSYCGACGCGYALAKQAIQQRYAGDGQ